MPIGTHLTVEAAQPGEVLGDPAADVIALPVVPGENGPVVAPSPDHDLGELAEVTDRLLCRGAVQYGTAPVDPSTASDILQVHAAKGEAGEVFVAVVPLGDRPGRLLLYGAGDRSPAALRKAGAAVARRVKGAAELHVVPPAGDLAAFTEGLLLGGYTFRIGVQRDSARPVPVATIVTTAPAAEANVRMGTTRAAATARARDLANMPSVEKGPAWLADQAEQIAAESGLTARVRDEHELAAGGFGGLLAVGAGSPRPPRLIELAYEPAAAARHVVLVGKGITFDSGGLSLKPTDNMKTMKTDMSGGAVVMAVMGALRELGVAVRVTGLIAAAENMPSGSAMRPSDVITHYGGKTSEVLNTDAEGRLVLADALAYADAELAPDIMVDVATLTGAAKVALGLRHGALFATDDELAGELAGAGTVVGEPLWRLPMIDEYRQAIESDVADVANIERRGFGGGSIMAALFLREFTGDRRWAHLDIAGPGRSTGDDAELTKGATGFGARLLLHWLTGLS